MNQTSRSAYIAAVSLGLMIISAAIVLVWFFSGFQMEAITTIEEELMNPSGSHKAIYYTVDAGATTSTGYAIAIRRTTDDDSVKESWGTVCSSDDSRLFMRWLNSDTLEIIVNSRWGMASKIKSEEAGITIVYIEYSERKDSLSKIYGALSPT